MTDIKPALTAAQWESKARRFYRTGLHEVDMTTAALAWGVVMDETRRKADGTPGFERYRVAAETPEERHALAALALYGQPFGFTREDVEALRVEARDLRVHAANCRAWSDVEATLEFERSHRIMASLADRIEALLPPEEKEP